MIWQNSEHTMEITPQNIYSSLWYSWLLSCRTFVGIPRYFNQMHHIKHESVISGSHFLWNCINADPAGHCDNRAAIIKISDMFEWRTERELWTGHGLLQKTTTLKGTSLWMSLFWESTSCEKLDIQKPLLLPLRVWSYIFVLIMIEIEA